jgi:hypothetical protein
MPRVWSLGLGDVVVVDGVDLRAAEEGVHVFLHALVGEVLLGVGGLVAGEEVGLLEVGAGQLVADGDPAGPGVVGPAEQFQEAAAGGHALDHAVDLIGLAAGLAHLGHDHVAVQVAVEARLALHAHKAVLLGVVQPVPGAAAADDAHLLGLDPDEFLDPLVAPLAQALPAQLHGPASDPEEDQPLVLQHLDHQVLHLPVLHGRVGQGHVDVPGRVRHYHVELAQHPCVQLPQVAADPLLAVARPLPHGFDQFLQNLVVCLLRPALAVRAIQLGAEVSPCPLHLDQVLLLTGLHGVLAQSLGHQLAKVNPAVQFLDFQQLIFFVQAQLHLFDLDPVRVEVHVAAALIGQFVLRPVQLLGGLVGRDRVLDHFVDLGHDRAVDGVDHDCSVFADGPL